MHALLIYGQLFLIFVFLLHAKKLNKRKLTLLHDFSLVIGKFAKRISFSFSLQAKHCFTYFVRGRRLLGSLADQPPYVPALLISVRATRVFKETRNGKVNLPCPETK